MVNDASPRNQARIALEAIVILLWRAAVVAVVLILEVGLHHLIDWVAEQTKLGGELVQVLDRITFGLVVGVYGMLAINTLWHMFNLLILSLLPQKRG